MISFSIQEARELAALAELMIERLNRAVADEAGASSLAVEERTWLESASRRVGAALSEVRGALAAAVPLPEFASQRKHESEALSGAWADAVERLFDGIVANVSANGPLVELLFPHQRFGVLRRPGHAAQQFWAEFERRAESSYVKRLSVDPEYGFLSPLLEEAKSAQRALQEAASPKPLAEPLAAQLRTDVSRAAEALDIALRQARSLVDAAFVQTPTKIAELGLDAKPKRRSVRPESAKAAPS